MSEKSAEPDWDKEKDKYPREVNVPKDRYRVYESDDLNDAIRWMQDNQGALYRQLDLEELGGVPSDHEDVRRLPFLQLKVRALEQAGLAFCISNALADRYEYMSPNFQELFHLSDEDVRQARITSFAMKYFHPEDFPKMITQVRGALMAGEPNQPIPMHLCYRFRIPERGIVWLECFQTVFLDEKKRPSFAIACYQDVTERKQAEEARDLFVNSVIHDLRSPLTIISGYLSIFREQVDAQLTNAQKQMLSRIEAASNKLNGMSNELLNLERIRAAELELYESDNDVARYLKSLEQDFHMLGHSKETQVELICQPELGSANFDLGLIEQVLENLISNAIKYSDRGKKVTITARRDEKGNIEIAVADNGVGIPPDEMEQLFQEFSRISSQPTEGEVSIGLGLAICKKIVEMHGGHIWCESAEGEGSTFYFTLPGMI